MEPVVPDYRNPPRRAAPWALSGADGRDPRVVRSLDLHPEALERHNDELQAKFAEIAANEVRWAGEHLDDAEVVIVAYGIAARVARTAIARAREGGLRAGLFRPISLWPFPSEALMEAVSAARAVLVVELSAGQLIEDVRMAVQCRVPVFGHGRTGGMVPSPTDVVAASRRAWATSPEPTR
jgi:2-oxoglutarate ferredoxin oxidoreductase subunit alpha